MIRGEKVDPLITVPDINENSSEMLKDYYGYYRTKRGYHPRSVNSGLGWTLTTMLSHFLDDIYARANKVTQPVLLVHGDKA